MRNDDRKKLLADYAVALVAERESWARLHEPHLTEAERCRILGEWKQVAASLKTMVRELRAAPAAPVFLAPSARSSDDGALVGPNPPAQPQVAPAAVDAPAIANANVLRRPSQVPGLLAVLRLITLWRPQVGNSDAGAGVFLMGNLRWSHTRWSRATDPRRNPA